MLSGFGNDGESGNEGCRAGRVIGTYLHGPLLPRNPWIADWLLSQALCSTGRATMPSRSSLFPTASSRKRDEVFRRDGTRPRRKL